jgi:AGZA family xanthine/uracil permease-like MFS transporter
MGLNAVVAFSLVAAAGLTMKAAMGIIVMEGIVITILVLTGLREAIFRGIPLPLKKAIAIGIGFFILFIGLVDGGIVIKGSGTLVTLGDFIGVPIAVTLFGLVVTIIMLARRWKAAILLGIIFSTVFATILNYIYDEKAFARAAVVPSKLRRTRLRLVGSHSTSSRSSAPRRPLGVPSCSRLLRHDGDGDRPRRRGQDARSPGSAARDQARPAGGLARRGGGRAVSSSARPIESGAGVGVGGRTGWVGIIVAVLFFAAMPFWPVAGVVPANATAPALIIVGFLMMQTLTAGEAKAEHQGQRLPLSGIDFGDIAYGLPAVLIMTVMPLTYSITNGIGAGFIAYTLIRIAQGKAREVSWMMYLASAGFIIYFAFRSSGTFQQS